MRKITLEKIDTVTPEEVRRSRGIDRDKFDAVCCLAPSVGLGFNCYFDRNGGDKYDANLVTSPVKSIEFESGNKWIFKTKNSTYRITFGEAFNE